MNKKYVPGKDTITFADSHWELSFTYNQNHEDPSISMKYTNKKWWIPQFPHFDNGYRIFVIGDSMEINPDLADPDSITDCYNKLKELYLESSNGTAPDEAMDLLDNELVLKSINKTVAEEEKADEM